EDCLQYYQLRNCLLHPYKPPRKEQELLLQRASFDTCHTSSNSRRTLSYPTLNIKKMWSNSHRDKHLYYQGFLGLRSQATDSRYDLSGSFSSAAASAVRIPVCGAKKALTRDPSFDMTL